MEGREFRAYLDLEEGIKHHWATRVDVNLVGCILWLVVSIRAPSETREIQHQQIEVSDFTDITRYVIIEITQLQVSVYPSESATFAWRFFGDTPRAHLYIWNSLYIGCFVVAGADFGGASDSVDELTSLNASGATTPMERDEERKRAPLMNDGSILQSIKKESEPPFESFK